MHAFVISDDDEDIDKIEDEDGCFHGNNLTKDHRNDYVTAIHQGAERMFSVLLSFLRLDSGFYNLPDVLAFLNNFLSIRLWQMCLSAHLWRLSRGLCYSSLERKDGAIVAVTHSVSTRTPLDPMGH